MFDLDAWIKAELKRGHKKEEVRQWMAAKGYPAQMIASVDAIVSSEIPDRKPDWTASSKPTSKGRKSSSLIIAAALFIAGLVLLVAFDKLSIFGNQSTTKAVSTTTLQPVSTIINNRTGEPIDFYSGMVTELTLNSLTLADSGKSRKFNISSNKVRYAKIPESVFVNSTSVGDKIAYLYFVRPVVGEPYVSTIVINSSRNSSIPVS